MGGVTKPAAARASRISRTAYAGAREVTDTIAADTVAWRRRV